MRKYIFLIVFSCALILIQSCNDDYSDNMKGQLEAQKLKRIQQVVDNRFFDYNYISAFNTRLEEISMQQINETGKLPDNMIKSGDVLYSAYVEEIRNYYQQNENKRKQIEQKFGLPMWDQLFELNLQDDKLAVIPLAKLNSTSVDGILYVFKRKNGKLKFHIAERGNFNKYPESSDETNGKKKPDREFVLSQFLLFDKMIFQYTGCDIIEEYKALLNSASLKSTICFYDSYIIETPYYYEVYVDGELVKREYSYSTYEYDVEYYCVNTGDNGGDPGGGNGGTTGGDQTGGKHWPAAVNKPCEGDPVMNASIAASKYSGLLGGTFGMTRSNGTQPHNGLDIYAAVGDPLFSMFGGVITQVGYYPNTNGHFYRMTSEINGQNYQITMAHMDEIYVKVGDTVEQGAIIGTSGRSGNAEDPDDVPNPHVHISIKKQNPDGSWPDGYTLDKYVDPMPFLSTTFNSDFSSNPCVNIGDFE